MPRFDEFDDESILTIGHLGIVAGAYDSLGIRDVIDRAIPKLRPHNLTHGDVIKAMVLNGLGFVERRLYLFPDFFDDIAVERLLGAGITRDQLNDDVLGRTLDAIAKYGPTELFNEIVSECILPTPYGSHCVHVDTTNFSVTGNYEDDFGVGEVKLAHGYPKDGRWDLKLIVLGMVSDQHGIPLFLQTFSGNESDKNTLRIIIEKLKENLKTNEKVFHVADSAFYTMPNLESLGPHTFWISRVLVSIDEAKLLVQSDCSFSPCADDRYEYTEHRSDYAGIPQQWVCYHSKMMHKRQEKTFEKKIEKRTDSANKSLKKLCGEEFNCEPDARRAAEKWQKEHPGYLLQDLKFVTVNRKAEKKRGRPRADEPMVVMYRIFAEITVNEAVIQKEKQKFGRFVLATNDLGLSPDELLTNYKNQGTVERGFRFLKDKSFRVAEIFLKKTSRIQALAMIMVLCLFIYSMTEFQLRKELEKSGQTVTGQTKKQTKRPTLKWIFFRFKRAREYTLSINGKQITRVTKLDPELKLILSLLWEGCEKYYS